MIIGKNLEDNSDFDCKLNVFLRTHSFIQSMTGGGKTSLILKAVETMKKERPDVQMIFIEDQEEFTEIPLMYKDIKYVSKESTPKIFTLKHAKDIGIQSRKLGVSMVINLHDFTKRSERAEFVAEFLKGFKSLGKKVGTPVKIFIDEAHQLCPRVDKKITMESKEEIIDLAKTGRKFNMTLVLSTQFLSDVDISARRECANRIVGKTTELRDRRTVAELMGLTNEQKEELFDFTAGNFYVRGEMFKKGVSRIFVPESKITRKQAGVANQSSEAKREEIKQKLAEMTDIFETAVENKNDQSLVEILQEKITDLEKQLAHQKIKTDQAWSEGFQTCDKQWKSKSKLERLTS